MRLRRFIRSPIAFWIGVAVLALVTWSVVSGIVGRAEVQAARFGSLRDAVVATRPVAFGAVVTAGDVGVRRVPAAFLPEQGVGSLADTVGRTAVAPLFAGQAVVRGQLAPEGLQGLAALLPAGTRAVAVPTGAATAPLRRGDVVDVLATFDSSGDSSGREPTFPVATDAVVVDVGPDAATVAVVPEQAKRVAFAVTQGKVTLAVGTPGQRTPVASSTSAPRPTIAR
ncbi:MAG: Flp pilus assembly protein CpaB [Actinomycetota bacterium]|nr:Flp pilus assembly protein CpaB [Actinomycetota bacterium]